MRGEDILGDIKKAAGYIEAMESENEARINDFFKAGGVSPEAYNLVINAHLTSARITHKSVKFSEVLPDSVEAVFIRKLDFSNPLETFPTSST